MGHSRAMRGHGMQSLYVDLFLPAVELVFGSACCPTHLGRHGQHPVRVLFPCSWCGLQFLFCLVRVWNKAGRMQGTTMPKGMRMRASCNLRGLEGGS